MGSAITYARRYSLSALVGGCPEDDDGSDAMGMTSTKSSQSLPRRSPLVTLQERAYSIITQIPHATEFIKSISKGDIDVAKLAEPLAKRVTGYGKDGMKDKVEEWLKKNQKEDEA